MILDFFDFENSTLYQGTVVDNCDPESKSRLRVKIDGINDKIETKDLPFWVCLTNTVNSNVRVQPNQARVLVYWIDPYNSIVLGAIASIPT